MGRRMRPRGNRSLCWLRREAPTDASNPSRGQPWPRGLRVASSTAPGEAWLSFPGQSPRRHYSMRAVARNAPVANARAPYRRWPPSALSQNSDRCENCWGRAVSLDRTASATIRASPIRSESVLSSPCR